MHRSSRIGAPAAADTLRRAVGVAPRIQSRETERGGLTAFFWRTPWLGAYELEQADEIILALHTGGSRAVRTRTATGWSDWTSAPGQLHVIPAGHSAAFKPDGRLEFVTLHFSLERLADLVGDTKARSVRLPFRFAFDDPFARECVRSVCEELRDPREHGSLFVDSVTDALWVHLLRSSSLEPERPFSTPTTKGIARARAKIESNLSTGLSLIDLAREAGMSRFYFARAFRETVGEPPHRYLTRCRIERAKKLLRDGDLPLSEIALMVGFSSQSHFASSFRAISGRTPRHYRIHSDE